MEEEKEKRKDPKNPHAGHRERLKGQYREHGLEPLTDYQVLELLLFYAIPRRDTNELAHRLLERFGSLRRVLEADLGALEETEGVGHAAAELITLVTAMNRRYLREIRLSGQRRKLENIDAICGYVRELFRYATVEEAHLICLDGGLRVLSENTLSEGTTGAVTLPVRELIELVLRQKAARVVLAHNHLADIALPSSADVASTRQLYQALQLIGVELTDHIIVAGDDCVSMRDSGYFSTF